MLISATLLYISAIFMWYLTAREYRGDLTGLITTDEITQFFSVLNFVLAACILAYHIYKEHQAYKDRQEIKDENNK